MSLKIITLASNPFKNTTTGIDDTIHAAYMDCFNAIPDETTTVRIVMYMWNNGSVANVDTSPVKLTEKIKERVKNVPVNCEILFDVDFYTQEETDNFKEHLEELEVGSKGTLVASYPLFKIPGSRLKNPPVDFRKLHNKTMLFSKLVFSEVPLILSTLAGQEIEYVVVESSANIWPSQYAQANQVTIFYGDKNFYDYTISRWNLLKKDVISKDLTKFSILSDPDLISGNVKSYALPRSGNIIESVLANIIKYNQGESSSIHITMADFSDKEISNKLIEIHKKNNFDVKLINRESDSFDAIKSDFEDEGLDFIVLQKKADNETDIKIHSKYLLFDGHYDLGEGVKRYKLIFAGSTNYTNFALDKNAETLYRIVDDAQYAVLLKNWYELRYTDSLKKISASVGIPGINAIYFFNATKYVKWIPSKGIDAIETNIALRNIGITGWTELPDYFKSNIDAALWYDGHIYFFKATKYCKYHFTTGIEKPEMRTIGVDGWKSLPQEFKTGIDAAIMHPTNGHAYFFKGNKYCKWKPNTGVVEPAVRIIGDLGWKLPATFLSGVDAALTHPTNNWVYFFKGNKYYRWTSDDNLDSQITLEVGVDGWEGILF
jgi:PLD-like domain/Hemopexin